MNDLKDDFWYHLELKKMTFEKMDVIWKDVFFSESGFFFFKDVQLSRLSAMSRNMPGGHAYDPNKGKQMDFIQKVNLFQRTSFEKSRLCSCEALCFWKRCFIPIFPYLAKSC
jgi:hypothetical protein